MGIIHSRKKSASFKDRIAKVTPSKNIDNLETRSYLISVKKLNFILNDLKDSKRKERILKYVPISCNYAVNRHTNYAERISDYRKTKKNITYHIGLFGITKSCKIQVSVQFYNNLNKLIK